MIGRGTSSGTFSHLDDGGADKSGDRRRRRLVRDRIAKVGAIVGGITLLLFIYLVHARSRTSNNVRSSNGLKDRILNRYHDLGNKDENRRMSTMHEKLNPEVRQHAGSKPKYRWTDPRMMPPPPHSKNTYDDDSERNHVKKIRGDAKRESIGKKIKRGEEPWDNGTDDEMGLPGPKVDYTNIQYEYRENILIPPRGGSYPPLEPLGELMKRWPQEDIDSPPQPFMEQLQHFDYLDPVQMEAAVKYRDLEFPFKVYNVPEINDATEKWTDEYLSYHFDRDNREYGDKVFGKMPRAKGTCQQSVDSFFAFFNNNLWKEEYFLISPPTRNNDFTFERFAKHARYADAVGLAPNEEHFYFQAGVDRRERLEPREKWGFISRDLPSFSSPNPTFFGFDPPQSHGIQCRLGERGVAAATHYDGGRNMIAMITGAKRYILSPPNECRKLGIIGKKKHPIYRHSLLNFGHINALDKDDPEVEEMSPKEREWLETSSSAAAIETVLKAGEVLYTPSHWFHYIISLQKSAQCNTRSGKHEKGSPEWGGARTVTTDCLEES